jgi:hypothetical protein
MKVDLAFNAVKIVELGLSWVFVSCRESGAFIYLFGLGLGNKRDHWAILLFVGFLDTL